MKDVKLIQDWNKRTRYTGSFGRGKDRIYFPLWYPALIFAIAGIAVLRIRPQFSIRSALIGLTVVAALLGMAVVL